MGWDLRPARALLVQGLVCQKGVELAKDCASTMLSQEGVFFTFMCDVAGLATL